MFRFFYLGIGWLLYLAALPLLLILSLLPKYRQSIPARFFLWRNPPFEEEGIWLHACSLGEVNALKPIIARLDTPVNLTVTTQTGYAAAGRLPVTRRYLPFEIFLPWWVRKQKALVVMEAELWYMLFASAKRRGIPTCLINARISDRSYGRYMRFGWYFRRVFAHVDKLFAQSEKDRVRLIALGARDVEVTGNIKSIATAEVTRALPKPQRELLILASTHTGEERMLLEALRGSGRTIVVVPRHPERFEAVARDVAKFCEESGCSFHRFSQSADLESDVVLMDRMGELVNLYAIADVVILGGSFVPDVGGHNPLEPAQFGVKLLSGRYIFNQEALFPLIENAVLCAPDALEREIAAARPARILARANIDRLLEVFRDVV